jgi:adenine-specific DNA-methyltransferase
MAKSSAHNSKKKPIEQYQHKDKKRVNNPPVGLVTSDSDKELPKKKYQYDPHLDPQLQWAGKAEIDEELIEAYKGTISLPFEPGE